MARGDELLVVDSRDADREGMRSLFEQAGYVCTATGDADEARELVSKKFFVAAVVDLDTGQPGAGIDIIAAIRERSNPTMVVLLTSRRSFEAAVEALRLGVQDVIVKRPDQIEQLRRAVDTACDRYHASADGGGDLLKQVQAVLDDAFRIMLDMGRKLYADISMASIAAFRPRVLVVEDNQEILRELADAIQERPWEVAAEMNGGAALDKAGDHRFDLVACRAELVDLKGTLVIKTIQAQHADTLGLVYTEPGPDGHIDIYREGSLAQSVRPFENATKLVDTLDRLADELSQTQGDRRVIQAFRSANEDFFRRYAELKMRLARLLE